MLKVNTQNLISRLLRLIFRISRNTNPESYDLLLVVLLEDE